MVVSEVRADEGAACDVIDVVLADDHPVVLHGLISVLSGHERIRVRATASNSSELMAILRRQACDVLISDDTMPGGTHGDGCMLFERLRRQFPAMRIVVLAICDNPQMVRGLLKHGIHGLLSKADALEHVSHAIHRVHEGARYYSPSTRALVERMEASAALSDSVALSLREAEVLRLFMAGMGVTDIARQLSRTKQTVSKQKHSALRKLGVSSDHDLFRLSTDEAWLRRVLSWPSSE
ncbi:DNA-binding response regulator [Burkholderia cepacia]|uniref:DNA-binding response regulator n=1 Tax=Burkholderia cepacia TaxID=292 RepID=A0A2S8I9G3_BURCE|nr:response regulator transcription factor [Burkholderia cepacia]PQP11426.1 DNA-binding response regulator [Burkholderia cepacia]HDR9511016.1 response regulator transcription factor [Burkholderia cepacia]